MSIYSTNDRVGAAATVVANESYRPSDIGRIMYESQLNDQALFEATLMADFAEINGLREGTLLESEIAAFNEANAKSFFDDLKKKLMSFWAKIKGVFKAATQKIAAYILRDGKAFVNEFEKFSKKKTFTGPVEGPFYLEYNDSAIKVPEASEADKEARAKLNGDDKLVSKDLVKKLLTGIVGEDVDDAASFKKAAMNKMLTKVDKIDSSNYNDLITKMENDLSTSKTTIGELKKAEDKVNKGLRDVKKIIEDEQRKAAGEDTDGLAKSMKRVSVVLAAYEDVISITTSAKIAAVKTSVINSRKAMQKIMADMKKSKNAKNSTNDTAKDDVKDEVEVTVAKESVEFALDDDLCEPIDSYTEAQIERLIADI